MDIHMNLHELSATHSAVKGDGNVTLCVLQKPPHCTLHKAGTDINYK